MGVICRDQDVKTVRQSKMCVSMYVCAFVCVGVCVCVCACACEESSDPFKEFYQFFI